MRAIFEYHQRTVCGLKISAIADMRAIFEYHQRTVCGLKISAIADRST